MKVKLHIEGTTYDYTIKDDLKDINLIKAQLTDILQSISNNIHSQLYDENEHFRLYILKETNKAQKKED